MQATFGAALAGGARRFRHAEPCCRRPSCGSRCNRRPSTGEGVLRAGFHRAAPVPHPWKVPVFAESGNARACRRSRARPAAEDRSMV